MRSVIGQIRQPHVATPEANKQTEQNDFDGQLNTRIKNAALAVREILQLTGHYVAEGGTEGMSHTMIGTPVDVGELPGETGLRGLHSYIRAYVAFDKDAHKEVEKGRIFKRSTVHYIPDFEKVTKVGVIFLTGKVDADELSHAKSAHWDRSTIANQEELSTIETAVAALQNVLSGQFVSESQIAS